MYCTVDGGPHPFTARGGPVLLRFTHGSVMQPNMLTRRGMIVHRRHHAPSQSCRALRSPRDIHVTLIALSRLVGLRGDLMTRLDLNNLAVLSKPLTREFRRHHSRSLVLTTWDSHLTPRGIGYFCQFCLRLCSSREWAE